MIVKARIVKAAKAGQLSTRRHLAYIQREAVARDGGSGRLYGADTDAAIAAEFDERSSGDRHQFRFIVSVEDAEQLDDLTAFTRELMSQMERDLGTRLDWVAADHWNTDNPHTHVLVRGKDENGKDLIIARDYISRGFRLRASELATEWLGRRSEREIQATLNREVEQERWTSLDIALQRKAHENVIDLPDAERSHEDHRQRVLLRARLQRLATMGLARPVADGKWALDPDLEATLRRMGERGDIIRTMQREFGEAREYQIFDAAKATQSVTGRVASKGLADEMSDRGYLMVDGLDGRAHYIPLAPTVDMQDVPIGAIVTAKSGAEPRPSDHTIAKLAENGRYDTQRHLAIATQTVRDGQDPTAYVQTHIHRLEALRRAGIVERESEQIWRIPPDFLERASAFNATRVDGAVIETNSHVPVDKQRGALGATWLDRQIVGGKRTFGATGFGAAASEAVAERENVLVEQGLAHRRNGRVIAVQNLIEKLTERELTDVSSKLESETGLKYQPVKNGQQVVGIYRRSLILNSGRFAMLETSGGFSLLPWRPIIEPQLGRNVSAILSGNYVTWKFSRDRSPSIER